MSDSSPQKPLAKTEAASAEALSESDPTALATAEPEASVGQAAPTRAKPTPAKPALDSDDPMPGVSDYQLLKLFRNGDNAAFEALVKRHTRICFGFIYRMVGNQNTADDLFQDTWLKVLRKAHTYKPRAKFSTWLLQIARNTTFDHYKRENLRQHASLDAPLGFEESSFASLVPSEGPQPEAVLLAREMTDEVQKAICRLPQKQQEALVLRIYHKMPYAEISELLGSPEGTVKYWVHEAIEGLTNFLEARGVV